MIAAPSEQSSKDQASVKRTTTLAWPPGRGPRMSVIRYGGRRGTQVFDGALVKAELVYEWSPRIEGWTRQASLFVVAPQGKGWSRFPVRVNDSSDYEAIAAELHRQYAPRTTVTLTEHDDRAAMAREARVDNATDTADPSDDAGHEHRCGECRLGLGTDTPTDHHEETP